MRPSSFTVPECQKQSPRIAYVTTCKGRLQHLRATLPKNIEDGRTHNAIFVVLDYNDREGLAEYIECEHKADLDSGILRFWQNKTELRFRMAHAKNQAHRCAMIDGADILVTVDADNFIGRGFADFLLHKFSDPTLSYLAPDFKSLPPAGQRYNHANPLQLGRGFAGRLAIRAQDFIKVGGYNETFETWRGEDSDILARLSRLDLKCGAIERIYLNAIGHNAHVRFREYPDAQKYENEDVYVTAALSHDTVVNYGNFGGGEVYRNFERAKFTLRPLPTRVFGIGMQRTGTTSLHDAFKMLGLDSAHWLSGSWAQRIWREMNRWGRSGTLEQHYALCDNPIPVLYEKLDKAYPGSKFILTVRDEDAWIRSVEKFWTYEGNPQRWTWDIDGFSHKMHGMIYGVTEFNENIFRERYRRHNDEVKRYFSGRSDLLVLEINEQATMAPLCRFLGMPTIHERFPHSHRTNR